MDEKPTEPQPKSCLSYGAEGSLTSLIISMKAQCHIFDGQTFDGFAWGFSFPGGGALFGDVYLVGVSTLDELYERTTNFKFSATPVYTAFYFLDSNAVLLGHFQAGSVSTVFGVGGGSGSWSQVISETDEEQRP